MQINNSYDTIDIGNQKNQENTSKSDTPSPQISGIKQDQPPCPKNGESDQIGKNRLLGKESDKSIIPSDPATVVSGKVSTAQQLANLLYTNNSSLRSAVVADTGILDSAAPDLHPRGKREARNGEPNPLLSLPLSPIPPKNNQPQPINLISIDPELISPIVQNQFRKLGGRVKDAKESMPPDILRQVSNFIKDRVKEAENLDIDPDKIYVNSFSGAEALQDGSDGVTGWQHVQKDMTGSKTLTECVLENFNDAWRYATTDQLNQSFGVYKYNFGAYNYGAKNEIKILPSELRKIFNKGDLEKYLAEQQESFWPTNAPAWRTLAKTEFSGLARKATLDGQLTKQGYKLAMLGAAPDVPLDKPAKLSQMRSEASSDPSVQVHRLDNRSPQGRNR